MGRPRIKQKFRIITLRGESPDPPLFLFSGIIAFIHGEVLTNQNKHNILKLQNIPKRIFEMVKKKENVSCASTGGIGCCQVESIVSVDDRGQMVLPKELREKAGIKPGDKLALVGCEKEGRICCIVMVKVEEFSQMIKSTLGPMLKEIV
jgi:AbrB family looped-hinge helix DNA binding protein